MRSLLREDIRVSDRKVSGTKAQLIMFFTPKAARTLMGYTTADNG
jgi:hypothetical protein